MPLRLLANSIAAMLALPAMSSLQAEPMPAFASWAEKPVMGWNSWNFYGTSLDETSAKAQADYMAANLLPFGYNVFTVDIQWYQPTASGFNYDPNATLVMDEWGRLLPAPNRFPTAANGAGFKPLGDYLHAKGLKLGLHIMRGIPRQAWQNNLPVKGTTFTARDIANTNSVCSWNPDMYGIDMSKPGAQAYYDSIFELYASWGVDFIKVDDLSRPYDAVQMAEVEAIRAAIDKTGRPIIFSTSPGDTPVARGAHVSRFANQWRISDDFWDNWPPLLGQFKRLHDWTPYRLPGRFPDADMLPLGKLAGGNTTSTGRATYFTRDEQRIVMTLWSIARSPLIHGGDMTQMDDFTLGLLTNPEVIAVNQNSRHNRQLYRDGDRIAWVAGDTGSDAKFLALFNTAAAETTVPVQLSRLGYSGPVQIRSLWEKSELGTASGTFSPAIPSHGAGLYKLTGPGLPTPWLAGIKAGNGQATLTWEALPSATFYRVKRATSESGPFTLVADDVPGTTTTFIDTGLANGTTYHYVISALIGSGESPDSGSLAVTPTGPPGIVGWNYDRYGTLTPDLAAGAEPAKNWNNSWPDDPRVDLRDANGQPTTLDITYTSHNGWSIQHSHPGTDADGSGNKELLNGYLNAAPNAATAETTVTLTDIPHGYYDIIVYFTSDAADREGRVTDGKTTFFFRTLGPAGISSPNATLARTSQTTDTAWPPANHAIFTGLSGRSQSLTVRMRDNDEWGGIAGFQVVPRPDPLPAARIDFSLLPGQAIARLGWPAALGAIVLQESTDLQFWRATSPQPNTNPFDIPLPGEHAAFYRLARP